MPLVVICSLVRDGMSYLPSYRRQLESLSLEGDLDWRLCILEGDSSDGSWEYLVQWAADDPRIIIGREDVGDTAEIQDRAERWARVCNACLALIPDSLEYSHMLWLEADLCFPPELLRRLLQHRVDVVAPIIYLGGLFYDTWGFRGLDGVAWTNNTPYHSAYQPMGLMEMSSVGSCVLFRRAILDAGIRFRGPYETGLLVGMCHDARAQGYRVFADTLTAILHPVDNWESQMWAPSRVEIVDGEGNCRELPLAEARRKRFVMHIAALDAGILLSAQRSFLRELSLLHRSNRFRIEVLARTYPHKRYQMKITVDKPQPAILGQPLLRGLLPERLFKKLLRRDLQSPLTIEME
ncbi:hypothetical protein [Geomonas sp.]|uniref:hypothetical protein n=1 Tax=Geomonas sp. TaxID=2651584 RepID=UPI002B49AECA|nr:hypothetical protein [Geomonas sp.]HJV35055.1 hypothetical protein [Geomonas sp.]